MADPARLWLWRGTNSKIVKVNLFLVYTKMNSMYCFNEAGAFHTANHLQGFAKSANNKKWSFSSSQTNILFEFS